MSKKHKYLTALIGALICIPLISMAKTDVSVAETDITFSKDNIVAGDNVTVYARVFNVGDTDVSASVAFLNNGKEMGLPQPVSLRPNTYDDVFIHWQTVAGIYNITAKLVGINPADDNLANDTTSKGNVFVDADINHNGIGDSVDPALATKTSASSANPQNSGLVGEILGALTPDNSVSQTKPSTDNEKIAKMADALDLGIPALKQPASFLASIFDSFSSYIKLSTKNLYILAGVAVLLIILFLIFRRRRSA